MSYPFWLRSCRGTNGLDEGIPFWEAAGAFELWWVAAAERSWWLSAERRRLIGYCHAQGLTQAETVQVVVGSAPAEWQVRSVFAELMWLQQALEPAGRSAEGGNHVLQ